jgi:c(7)-type cytochrome triheme protein
MRNSHDIANRSERLVAPRSFSATKQRVLAVMILLTMCIVTLVKAFGDSGELTDKVGLDVLDLYAASAIQDWSKFSHKKPREHEELMGPANCVSCHRRNDSSPLPRLPVHKDCTGCHLVQFTAATSADNPICTICHTREGLDSSNPPTDAFPGLFSFDAKFDHAQHLLGIETALPKEGCVACHTPANRGVAQTIPARLNAHQTCYQCHSPGKQASSSSSCGFCHGFRGYSRTPSTARAYRVGFSHADHTARKTLSCENCHKVNRKGLPQAQQVSSILSSQHYSNPRSQSCMTCHNGKRAFGDRGPGFTDCRRCHKGLNFRA